MFDLCERCAENIATGVCPSCKFKLCTRCRAEDDSNSRCPRCFAKETTGRKISSGDRSEGWRQPTLGKS